MGGLGEGGGGRGESVGPLQCFAVGEHQSRAHLAAISAIRLQWDPILREQEGHEAALRHCTPPTALCSIIHSYN